MAPFWTFLLEEKHEKMLLKHRCSKGESKPGFRVFGFAITQVVLDNADRR